MPMLFPPQKASSSPSQSAPATSLPDAVDQIPSVPSSSKGGLRGMLSDLLDSNPYFSAGFGLMGVGAVLAIARKSAAQIAVLTRRRLLVTLEISSKDPAYLWFLQWMSAQNASIAAATSSTASTPLSGLARFSPGMLLSRIKSHELAVETTQEHRPDGSANTSFSLVPGPGVHYFKYNSAWFQVKRERDGKMMDLHSGTPWETAMITTLSRDRTLFPQLLAEAKELANKARIGRTVIYTAWGAEWRPFGQPRARRLLDSVVLDKGLKERIVQDVQGFMSRGKWYSERGIPYRRGYLLFGPPGSGKSSFIQALAGSLEYNISILNLSERGLTDDKLNHLLANAPERSIILLEDVDAAFSARQQTDESGYSGSVTFSGLLNALDGVASSTSQRILFMTTNHISRLDPALIRPGRVDLQELIDDATPYQASKLYKRFYAEDLSEQELSSLEQEIISKIEAGIASGERVSMAALQGHFIRFNAREALERWDLLLETSAIHRQKKVVVPSMPS